MMFGQKIRSGIPTPSAAIWFALKWDALFIATALVCFVCFRADQEVLALAVAALFSLLFFRDCLNYYRRARKGVVNRVNGTIHVDEADAGGDLVRSGVSGATRRGPHRAPRGTRKKPSPEGPGLR